MRHILIGAIILGAGLAGWAGEATRSVVEPGAVVEQIRRLGDRSGEVRAGAVGRLVRMGKEALPELVNALGSDGEEARAAAAEAIRKILANDPGATADGRHDRAFWEKRAAQVRAGMSWDEALAVLFPEMTAAERGNVRAGGVGDSFAAVRILRLDGYWSARIYVRGTQNSTVTRPPVLAGRTRSVFVGAPAGYTGVWTTWYVNGQKASEAHYRDGRYDGLVTRFYDDGINKSSETTYVQGVSNGPYRGWFQSGREQLVGSFKNGRSDGQWTNWYESGQVRSVEEWKDGQRHGVSTRWYENGQKEWEEHYANGKKDGLDSYWDQGGKQRWQRVYRDGRVIENQPISGQKAAAAEKAAPPVVEPPPQRGATVSEIEARMRERRGRDLAIEWFERLGATVGRDLMQREKPAISLYLSHKDVSDADLTHVEPLTSLRWLELFDTKITDAGLRHLSGLRNLETLILPSTITGAGLENLRSLTELQRLDLYAIKLGDVGLEHVASLSKLRRLNLTATDAEDAGLRHLAKMQNLRELLLSKTKVGDAGLAHLRGLTNLEVLLLDSTQVADAGLEHLSGMMQLRCLDLANTKITDAGLKHLRGLSGLETLHLSGTQVTDAGLEHLKNLSHLKMVTVLGTNVTQGGAAELRRVLPNVIVGGVRGGATTAPAVDPDVQEIERRIRERRMREGMQGAAPVPATRPAGDGPPDAQDEILKRMRERRAREMRGEIKRDAPEMPATKPSSVMEAGA